MRASACDTQCNVLFIQQEDISKLEVELDL